MEDTVSTMEDPDFRKPMYKNEDEWIVKARRRGRKYAAGDFRANYFHGRCQDEKTCIWPEGRQSWSDDSSGITWVGVHGIDSVCVVTKAVDLDLTRVHGFLIFDTKEEVLRKFRRAAISEVEDIVDSDEDSEDSDEDSKDPDEDSEDLEMLDPSIKIPFGVVSLVPLNDKVHKASSGEYQESKYLKFLLESLDKENEGQTSSDESEIDEADEDARIRDIYRLGRRHRRTMPCTLPVPPGYDERKSIRFLKKEMEREEMERDASITISEAVQESIDEYDEQTAIEFLQEKVKRKEDFTLDGTIQTAIAAFQHLFKKKFKATEIEVSVMDPEYFVLASEAYYKDIYIKHLETSEIEEVLATMTEPGGRGSPMSSDGGGSPMSSSSSSNGGGDSSGGSPMSSSSDGSD